MAESSLTLDYDEFRSKVGDFMGYGRRKVTAVGDGFEVESWDADQLEDIENAVQDGLREFYAPPRLPGMNHAHHWSFLRQMRTFVTTQNTVWEYQLPDEYAGYEGSLTIRSSTQGNTAIAVVGESLIREQRAIAGSVQSGRPMQAAILDVSERRHMMIFYPTPDAAYLIEGKMFLAPNKLSRDNPYPYGGTHHSQTILEAMLAAAERIHGDMDGHHRGAFYERLAASIQIDKQSSRGDYHGYVGDPGCPEEGYFRGRRTAWIRAGTGTRNGESYVMQ